MRDNQNKYLDKVVEFLVRDTKIDYDEGKIYFPFLTTSIFSFLPSPPFLLTLDSSSFFSKYCKNVYGLTNQEIEYVWDQYKDIILDKI